MKAIRTKLTSSSFRHLEHQQARKLQKILWSLIARVGDCPDLRMRHLRMLWIKQARSAEMEGGYAFRAFNMRITYVNIIQLMVSTATLLVVTLRA